MMTNQKGEEINDEWIGFPDQLDPSEVAEVLLLLIEQLNLILYRTNGTKHGITQLELRPQ